ncbi:MAG TPA: hypothetical protein ENJ01_11155 [Gammaproteobacteria bacterium]|nr:hypothetical protein [Gammaproteobacteria bacterium]
MQRQYAALKVLLPWLFAMVFASVVPAVSAETRVIQAQLLLAQIYAGADNMEGRVLSQKTGQPLAGVSVSLVDADSVVMDVTTTDKEGNFNIELDVLDDSGLEAIRLLYLKFERKNGKAYLIPVKKLIKSFTRTVLLQDVSLP